jgi:hypothetical protein
MMCQHLLSRVVTMPLKRVTLKDSRLLNGGRIGTNYYRICLTLKTIIWIESREQVEDQVLVIVPRAHSLPALRAKARIVSKGIEFNGIGIFDMGKAKPVEEGSLEGGNHGRRAISTTER